MDDGSVSTHSRPKAAGLYNFHYISRLRWFQHTAARRRLEQIYQYRPCLELFQHTAARRRLVVDFGISSLCFRSFNTQPPEGGWQMRLSPKCGCSRFNTQPPEGGWMHCSHKHPSQPYVSTHSRPKAAGRLNKIQAGFCVWFQHTAARRRLASKVCVDLDNALFQHTAARRRLVRTAFQQVLTDWFQHTAARRRLDHRQPADNRRAGSFNTQPPEGGWSSRSAIYPRINRFNTQPPEGGWNLSSITVWFTACFNTQPPEGGWPQTARQAASKRGFNTQPPEGGWFSLPPARCRRRMFQHTAARRRLEPNPKSITANSLFQHTAARRRLAEWMSSVV